MGEVLPNRRTCLFPKESGVGVDKLPDFLR